MWIVGPLMGPGLYRLVHPLPFFLTAAIVLAAAAFVHLRLRPRAPGQRV